MSKIRGHIAQWSFTTFGVAGGCLGILALMALGPLFLGFVIMLGFGVVHHEVSASVPPVGYWPSVLLGFVVSVVGGALRGGAK